MRTVKSILEKASKEQREGLRKLLDTVVCENDSPDQLIRGIRWLHRNLFEDFYRDVFDQPESYKDILHSVCNHLKVPFKKYETCAELEGHIAQKVMDTVWNKMTATQREEMEAELIKIAENLGKKGEWLKAGGLAGAVVAAELGGFTTYILATSGLAAITGVIGITLPFAVYTTMTTAMGVILGPVGWIGAGIFAIWKITGPNFKKLIPAILYISLVRQLQNSAQ